MFQKSKREREKTTRDLFPFSPFLVFCRYTFSSSFCSFCSSRLPIQPPHSLPDTTLSASSSFFLLLLTSFLPLHFLFIPFFLFIFFSVGKRIEKTDLGEIKRRCAWRKDLKRRKQRERRQRKKRRRERAALVVDFLLENEEEGGRRRRLSFSFFSFFFRFWPYDGQEASTEDPRCYCEVDDDLVAFSVMFFVCRLFSFSWLTVSFWFVFSLAIDSDSC